jgi:hypothetical protein
MAVSFLGSEPTPTGLAGSDFTTKTPRHQKKEIFWCLGALVVQLAPTVHVGPA